MEPQRPAVARKDHRLSTESLVSDKGAPPLSEAAVRDVALRIDLPAPPAPAPRRTSGRVASVAPETKAALSRAKRYGREVLGRRVRVFWHEEQTWYTGRVKDFTEVQQEHLVLYDDGDSQYEALGKARWERRPLCPSPPHPISLAADGGARPPAVGTGQGCCRCSCCQAWTRRPD